MRHGILLIIALLPAFVFGTFLTPALAQSADEPFLRNLIVKATAISNELLEARVEEDDEIKSQSAVAEFGQISVPVNEHFVDLEVSDAYTLKPDGRRIPVPQDKILSSTLPNTPQLGMFQADVRVRTIVFPDVEAGDHVRFTTKFRDKVSPLPGGFQLVYDFPSSMRFNRVEISLDAPADLKVHTASSGFVETVSTEGSRKVLTWTKAPQAYHADEPGATAAIDRDPRVIVSSYSDEQALGRAFLDGAAPMSEPTANIRALADDITKGLTNRRDQARAVSEWVTRNVRYMAILLGAGGWIPHDADSVSAAKYGDCKDHTTLMRALLAAKGIDADYALINLEPTYRRFDVPFRFYDHVILYLPEFDLYTDPTATYATFGTLLQTEADKPVLRVGKSGVLAAHTPALKADANRITIKADVTLRADGTPIGTAITEAAGPIADELRHAMAQAYLDGGEAFVKKQLNRHNWLGDGNIELHDATDYAEPYIVKTSFDLSNKFFGEGPNPNAIPSGPRLVASPYTQAQAFIQENRTQDMVCFAGVYDQIIDVHLPDGRDLLRLPRNVDVSTLLASYKSSYVKSASNLHVERRFVSRVTGQVCTPEIAKEVAPVALAASRDLGVRLDFRDDQQ